MPILQRATGAGTLANLVALDGASGGFVKDSEVSTFARTYLDDTSARAMCATLGLWYPLAKGGVQATHTGNTDETALATIQIPAGAMGPNGALRIVTLWSNNNSGNNKTFRVRLGGISGTVFFGQPSTTTVSLRNLQWIHNRNAQNSQISGVSTSSTNLGTSSGAVTTGAIDTSAAVDLVLSVQLANGGDNAALESYLVEVLYGA